MRLKQCHKPPMTGNGNHGNRTTYKICDDWEMVCGIVTTSMLKSSKFNFELEIKWVADNRQFNWRKFDDILMNCLIFDGFLVLAVFITSKSACDEFWRQVRNQDQVGNWSPGSWSHDVRSSVPNSSHLKNDPEPRHLLAGKVGHAMSGSNSGFEIGSWA